MIGEQSAHENTWYVKRTPERLRGGIHHTNNQDMHCHLTVTPKGSMAIFHGGSRSLMETIYEGSGHIIEYHPADNSRRE